MKDDDCFVCRKHEQGSIVPGGVIYEDELVYAGHVLPEGLTDAYIGHLMAEPKRHVPGLGELTNEEASALGRLVNDLARALQQVQGAEHVYSFVLGDEVDHLHMHVVPRYSGTPREYWGSRLGEWPAAPRGGVDEMAAVCDLMRGAVAHEQGTVAGQRQSPGLNWRAP